MSANSIFNEAAAALKFNRQRSILTTISLAWGVACFVILYSYGDGFHFALRKAFMAVGQDLVLMFGGQTSTQAGGERAGRKIRLERTDVDAIRDTVPLAAAVSPEAMVHGAPWCAAIARKPSRCAPFIRFTAHPQHDHAPAAGSGRRTKPQKQRVAVIGAEAARKMFGEIPPEGEDITINGLHFTVIGVLKTKTQISNYNTPDNECVFIPYDTASLLRDIKYPDDIVWMPANPVFRAEAVRQVRETLARVHNFSPNDERAVRIFVFNEFMRIVDTMGIALQVLLGFIGTLTLAIGGVGLANIMLVSVTQRTREIGVLKSIGATRRSILFQFLLEAMAIVTVGGVLGRGVRARRDRHAADAAAARAAVQRHQRRGRHPLADFAIRGDDFDAAAGDCGVDRGAAAGDQGGADGSD